MLKQDLCSKQQIEAPADQNYIQNIYYNEHSQYLCLTTASSTELMDALLLCLKQH